MLLEEEGSERLSAEELFRAHATFVATFLYRLGTPRADIDDLVQEVFVIAHRKGGYVRGPAQPRSWLGAIASRVARTGRRSRSRTDPPNSPAIERAATPADAPERIDTRRELTRVQRALESLPLEQRAAFVLYELEGESCESIAAVWGVPLGTVYSRLHHARRRFLQVYESQAAAGATTLAATAVGKR
ncbi:MAG TPA: sigma-70 family RNA polymerase sigma factor [Polyangiales bacterium]|nr:sigma-70 family RNA polymerase sigma factor [Polyangiales bacterium]